MPEEARGGGGNVAAQPPFDILSLMGKDEMKRNNATVRRREGCRHTALGAAADVGHGSAIIHQAPPTHRVQ